MSPMATITITSHPLSLPTGKIVTLFKFKVFLCGRGEADSFGYECGSFEEAEQLARGWLDR